MADSYLRVHAVNIYVKDQARSLDFYLNTLGFHIAFDAHVSSASRWTRRGEEARPAGETAYRAYAAVDRLGHLARGMSLPALASRQQGTSRSSSMGRSANAARGWSRRLYETRRHAGRKPIRNGLEMRRDDKAPRRCGNVLAIRCRRRRDRRGESDRRGGVAGLPLAAGRARSGDTGHEHERSEGHDPVPPRSGTGTFGGF